MIRKAYFEDPAYVPLLLRAYELWRELEHTTGQELLRITGLLMVGYEAAEVITGAQLAAREHDLPLESLSTSEIRRRYPMLRVQDDEIGVFEPDGGVLDPERSVQAHLQAAAAAGAQMRFGTTMESWEATANGFVVRLTDGATIESSALVLSLGPWFQEELGKLGVTTHIQRNIQAWFTPATNEYAAGRFPPFLLDRKGLPSPLYGFPDFGDGVKAAFHAHGDFTEADRLEREIDPARDIAPIARVMEEWMPGAAGDFPSRQALPLHAHAGQPLCGRSSSSSSPPRPLRRILRPRFQVRAGDRRDLR